MQSKFKIDFKALFLLVVLLFSLGVKAFHTHEHNTLLHAKHIEDTCTVCQFTVISDEIPSVIQITPPVFEVETLDVLIFFVAPYVPVFYSIYFRRGPPIA
ncbi:hypothetical protein EDL98_05410 [Ornithobacterium rhinotracheale]|uniref:hypothetical protein n=1 Tax=Ornithobacterium rhinotracheale TaxID=28251 RepID=UPI00129CBCBF|nr:hypothetical protein [Ornithobacterium rhinotracheale]MRJ10518.1 hypothetical protein [Ornithobacterium rhinotracheale]